jgi:plasmid stability protein
LHEKKPLRASSGLASRVAQLASAPVKGLSDTKGRANIGAFQASASAVFLDAPANVTAGVPFDVTVTAVDSFGQVVVGHSGTVTFSTTDPDPGVVLPTDYSFTADDTGLQTFTDTGLGETTLRTPGDQMLREAGPLRIVRELDNEPSSRVYSLDRKLGNQQNGEMKTTLDLPDSLVKQVKLRALQEGRKLKDAVADLLRKGLGAGTNRRPDAQALAVTTDKKTGLPLIECRHAAAPEEELTPERVAEILLAQDR